MKLTPEFIKWASSLKIHPEVLSQAHARLAPHPETTEGRDFYLGFLQVMVPARERYRKSFLGNQTEPIQDRNCRFFLWTGLLTEGALVLIPDDYHWHDWCGSRLKKNEEAIRDDQGRAFESAAFGVCLYTLGGGRIGKAGLQSSGIFGHGICQLAPLRALPRRTAGSR